MQFFALILVNVAMFAIFYLLVSLKLERKATEFREKRMRRIMEEMISEFNETAERNISILENRINTLRRLLKISGEVSSLDVRLMDDASLGTIERKKTSTDTQSIVFSQQAHERIVNTTSPRPNTGELLKVLIHDGADAISKTFKNILCRARGVATGTELTSGANEVKQGCQEKTQKKEGAPHHEKMAEVDFEKAVINGMRETGKHTKSDDNEELAALFSATKDKYALVSDLYARGYSIEAISRSSGIPQGEIRLVLNLGMQ